MADKVDMIAIEESAPKQVIYDTYAERPIIDSYSKAIANRGKRTLYLKHLESNRKLAGWLYKYQLIDTDTYIATLGRIRRDLMRP